MSKHQSTSNEREPQWQSGPPNNFPVKTSDVIGYDLDENMTEEIQQTAKTAGNYSSAADSNQREHQKQTNFVKKSNEKSGDKFEHESHDFHKHSSPSHFTGKKSELEEKDDEATMELLHGPIENKEKTRDSKDSSKNATSLHEKPDSDNKQIDENKDIKEKGYPNSSNNKPKSDPSKERKEHDQKMQKPKEVSFINPKYDKSSEINREMESDGCEKQEENSSKNDKNSERTENVKQNDQKKTQQRKNSSSSSSDESDQESDSKKQEHKRDDSDNALKSQQKSSENEKNKEIQSETETQRNDGSKIVANKEHETVADRVRNAGVDVDASKANTFGPKDFGFLKDDKNDDNSKETEAVKRSNHKPTTRQMSNSSSSSSDDSDQKCETKYPKNDRKCTDKTKSKVSAGQQQEEYNREDSDNALNSQQKSNNSLENAKKYQSETPRNDGSIIIANKEHETVADRVRNAGVDVDASKANTFGPKDFGFLKDDDNDDEDPKLKSKKSADIEKQNNKSSNQNNKDKFSEKQEADKNSMKEWIENLVKKDVPKNDDSSSEPKIEN